MKRYQSELAMCIFAHC